METLKIRKECASCRFFSGSSPQTAACAAGENPNCFRKKKTCRKHSPKQVPFPGAGPSAKGKSGRAVAYTDGSYNKETGKYGYAAVVLIDGKQRILSGSGTDTYNGWQILGEIYAALAAVKFAIDSGCREIEIRYDYMGVEMWATRQWKRNKTYTQQYEKDMAAYAKKINIRFTHVKAHSGINYNELADQQAKAACGVAMAEGLPDATGVPDMPAGDGCVPTPPDLAEGVNKKCLDAIKAFLEKNSHSFTDYVGLRTYGRDALSNMGTDELMEQAEALGIKAQIESAFKEGSQRAKAVRWVLRGLPCSHAVKKVYMDEDITATVVKARQKNPFYS